MARRGVKCKPPVGFLRDVRRLTPVVLAEQVLAVDPATGASSDPGYAWFVGGVLRRSGVIPTTPGQPTPVRLVEIYNWLATEFPEIDVLVVERLRGSMVPAQLHWATGVIIAAVDPSEAVLEMPIQTWKRYAKLDPNYTKTDEQDAIAIGQALFALIKE